MPGTSSTKVRKMLQVFTPWNTHCHSLLKSDVLGVACPVRMVRVSGLPRCSYMLSLSASSWNILSWLYIWL